MLTGYLYAFGFGSSHIILQYGPPLSILVIANFSPLGHCKRHPRSTACTLVCALCDLGLDIRLGSRVFSGKPSLNHRHETLMQSSVTPTELLSEHGAGRLIARRVTDEISEPSQPRAKGCHSGQARAVMASSDHGDTYAGKVGPTRPRRDLKRNPGYSNTKQNKP